MYSVQIQKLMNFKEIEQNSHLSIRLEGKMKRTKKILRTKRMEMA